MATGDDGETPLSHAGSLINESPPTSCMKIFVLSLVVVLLGALGIGAYFLMKAPDTVPTPPPAKDPFGSAGGSGVGSGGVVTPPTEMPTRSLALLDGREASVPDFTLENQTEVSGPETGYDVGGSSEGDYHVLYFPEDSYFLISIFAEPIGANRLLAEAELRRRLKLPDEELCALNVDVFTTVEANESYAGMSLGLSFCRHAVPLPN